MSSLDLPRLLAVARAAEAVMPGPWCYDEPEMLMEARNG
jgi:hypothetical protein